MKFRSHFVTFRQMFRPNHAPQISFPQSAGCVEIIGQHIAKPAEQIRLPKLANEFPKRMSISTIEKLPEQLEIEPEAIERKKKALRRYLGILLAIFATFIYSIATLFVKLLRNYHPFTISMWRFLGFIIPSTPTLLYHIFYDKRPTFSGLMPLNDKNSIKMWSLLVLRSILGCSSLILQVYAVQMINMSDASAIVFSSSVFITLIAHVVLGEKAGIYSVFCAVFTFVGVIIITRPPMLTGQELDQESLVGCSLAFASMSLGTFYYIILRYLREIHYSVVTITYGILGFIQCLILAYYAGYIDYPHSAYEWGLVIGLIIFTYGGQTCLILAYKFENAGPVSLIQSLDIVFAFIWQLIFIGVFPDIYSISGAGIVISGVSLISFRKYLLTLPEDHPTRQRFYFCLF